MSEKSLKNLNKSNLDSGQMYNAVFDGEKDAFRMTIVDGVDIKVENLSIPELKLPEFAPIVVPEIKEIRIPEIIRETQFERVEIPVIVKEIQTIEIEKPVYITEVKVVEIEKPVIIKEIEYKVLEQKIDNQVPTLVKVCMIVQSVALLALALSHVL